VTAVSTQAPPTAGAGPQPGGGARGLIERLERLLKRWPLTWRLVTVLVVTLLAALALTSLVTQLVLRSYLGNRTVEELTAAGQSAAENDAQDLMRTNHVATPGIPSRYAVLYFDATGRRLSVQPSAVEPADPAVPALTLRDPRVLSGEVFRVGSVGAGGKTSDEPRWLVTAGQLSNSSGTYAVAASLGAIDDTIAKFQAASLGIGLAVAGACAALGYAGVTRGMRPLREMEDTAAAIADGDLTPRLPEHPARDEVGSLSQSLNAMLARLESSLAVREASEERMRRFVTDASHELRTPLATIRGYAELYRQGAAATPEATAAAMRRIEDEATRMSLLVEDLLTLARLDNRRPMSLGEVDVTVLAADAVQDARVREPGRSVRLVGLGERPLGPAVVRGDESRLRQVVTNLVANALQHTPAGTPVEVAVGPTPVGAAVGDGVRLEVRDHGPGIPEHEIDKVFQRFHRGDPSRGRSSGGSGLGLAIVMAIVAAHSGRVGVRPTRGGGATFVVELPETAPVAPGTAVPSRPSTPSTPSPATPTEGAR
jgi:two-component system OmpR family sensor kinase